uniref:Amine oxidase domain-containing protein n=1 Tax=viral metagenome TaxID=1070528 RepID=A0A6C0JEQ6_9ZZZZ
MNYYDYIFIGASIPCLLASTTINRSKKILIVEKDNYLGGAWRIESCKYKNIDLVGHLIVPTNNKAGDKIISYFKNIGLELEQINEKYFLFETKNYTSNNKKGKPIISKYGWVEFYKKITIYVKKFKNINIITNTEITKITYTKNSVILNSNYSSFICGKVIIPMYCNISKIFYNNTFIDIPYQTIINTHVLLDISFQNILNITKNYQAFLDKEPIGVFDRVTVSKMSLNNCILSCRISKKYKNLKKEILEKLFFPFLKEKKILNDSHKINEIYYYNYECSYRDTEYSRDCLTNNCVKINTFFGINRIFTLNTIYMGHFLENFIENRLNIT